MPRFTRAELEAARSRTVDDVLPHPGDPPLRVLFCGINPGLVTAATGHHFARPGNRFWPALHGAGFTPRLLLPAEQGELRALGLGVTNMAPRTTARADELTPAELVAGGQRLRALVAERRPRWLAVVGVTAYRTAFGMPRASVGPQVQRLGATAVWVLPNPSGLNAHWQLPAMIAEYARLRAAADEPSNDPPSCPGGDPAEPTTRGSRAPRPRLACTETPTRGESAPNPASRGVAARESGCGCARVGVWLRASRVCASRAVGAWSLPLSSRADEKG